MFKEFRNLTDRYSAARAAGFLAVECVPYEVPLEKLIQVKNNEKLEQVLINAPLGKEPGSMGLAAIPGKEEEFRESIDLAVKYAKGLGCQRVHIMAGKVPTHEPRQAALLLQLMEKVYLSNLQYAADVLQTEGILALIEPINTKISVPGYYLESQYQAIDIIKKLNHNNLKLQLDLFHAQIMDGYLTYLIKTFLPYIGHIQIAQVPYRGEPDSAGEINYPYIFKLLQDVGYDGYIGCEYTPTTANTEDSLGWFDKWTK